MRRVPRFAWPLRRWLLLFLVGVALLAFFGMIVGSLFISEEWPVRQDLKDRIVAERELWKSENWQRDVASALQQEGMAAELYDAEGVLLFRFETSPPPSPGKSPGAGDVRRRWVDHVEVFRDGRFAGHARIAHPWLGLIDNRGTNWRSIGLMIAFVAGAAVLTAAFGIWLFSRIVLTPLSLLSDAAEDIRQGRLDVVLPRSRVREVQRLIDDFGRMVEGLQQSVRRQATVEEERRFFVAAIAHDLRTPLFSLRGRLEGMRDGVAKTPEQIRHYLDVALGRVRGLEKLVADLFAYTRMELTEYEPDLTDIDLSGLVQTAAAAFADDAAAKGVSLKVCLPTSEEPAARTNVAIDAAMKDATEPTTKAAPNMFRGDPGLLARALDNLLDNALRHTPRGGSIEIGVGSRVGNESENGLKNGPKFRSNRVRIWVADTGEGISALVAKRLANESPAKGPFHYRSDGGLGLGLAIVHRAAQLHGGTLTARNRSAGGALFVLEFPLDPPALTSRTPV